MSNARDGEFLQLFMLHRSALRRFVSKIIPSSASVDDIVQDTFLRIYTAGVESFRSPRSLMFVTARNLAVNHLRNERRRDTARLDDVDPKRLVEDAPSIEDHAASKEELRIVSEAMMLMSPQCREVFRLRRVEGLSYNEIGQRLGLSPRTVEKHIARGMVLCVAHFEERTGRRPDLGQQRGASVPEDARVKTGHD